MGKQAASFIFLLFTFHKLSLITFLAATHSTLTDESSLLSFKAKITHDPTNMLATNWSTRTSVCTWIGVTCNPKNQRVTGLNLSYMGLEGSIAKEIGNLSFLNQFDMSNNSFSGVIPNQIGNLIRLRYLNMPGNQFDGSIPRSFGKLRNLEHLSLHDNHLVGNIPWSIFNLSSLQRIDLSINQLSGALPIDVWPNLRSLEYLSLKANQLSGEIPTGLSTCEKLILLKLGKNNFTSSIPTSLGNLSQLQILSLFENKLSGNIHQATLWNLTTLKWLNLNYNELTGTIPPSIGNLINLRMLAISFNNLHGMIPSEIGCLHSLASCVMAHNQLHGKLPLSIFNLSTLELLEISNNKLSGSLPSSIANDLPNLAAINLGSNNFSGRIPSTITNLSRLNDLLLGENSFHGQVPINLGNLRYLKKLTLFANQFMNDLAKHDQDFLTSLNNCKCLQWIVIGSNPLTGELPKSLSSSNMSRCLEVLAADNCRINSGIPSEIGNLSSLISLRLEHNDLTGPIPAALGGLMSMQMWIFEGNKLRGSIPDTLCNLQKLYMLSLSDNEFSGPLPQCLTGITSLQNIYLDGNAFSSNIPSTLWANDRIQVVYLSYNFFEGSIPPEIGKMKSVRELDLSGNQLSGRIPPTIGQLEMLINISLSNNMLQGPMPDSFANLKDLHSLDLSHNHISGSIPMSLETLPNLEYFNISFNELTGSIPDKGPFANFSADFFKGNKALCGASRFRVMACRGRNKRIDLRYVIPATLVAVVVVMAIVVGWFMKSFSRKHSRQPSLNLALGLNLERISYLEILHATRNLAEENLIGRGSLGSVYKAVFSNATTAAVKVFNLDVEGALKSFDTECLILRSICHRNLVKIITSCSNFDFKALVMKYMPNGNLDRWLHSNDCFLCIRQRLGIMIDVATALDYLHHGCSSQIIHCDLKPSNILLDMDMVACVSDFGISKLLGQDQLVSYTKNIGTIGYIAPECGSTGLVSTKADVYSYGILLVEIFTRKKPTDEMFDGDLSMTAWVSESFPNAIMQIVDDALLQPDIQESVEVDYERSFILIMQVALECITRLAEERPNMNDVLVRLKKIKTELDQP